MSTTATSATSTSKGELKALILVGYAGACFGSLFKLRARVAPVRELSTDARWWTGEVLDGIWRGAHARNTQMPSAASSVASRRDSACRTSLAVNSRLWGVAPRLSFNQSYSSDSSDLGD
jgi:hypothetical protein